MGRETIASILGHIEIIRNEFIKAGKKAEANEAMPDYVVRIYREAEIRLNYLLTEARRKE